MIVLNENIQRIDGLRKSIQYGYEYVTFRIVLKDDVTYEYTLNQSGTLNSDDRCYVEVIDWNSGNNEFINEKSKVLKLLFSQIDEDQLFELIGTVGFDLIIPENSEITKSLKDFINGVKDSE